MPGCVRLLQPAGMEGGEKSSLKGKRDGKKKKKKNSAIFVSWIIFAPTQLTPLMQAFSYQIGIGSGQAMPKHWVAASSAPSGKGKVKGEGGRGKVKGEAEVQKCLGPS